MPATEPAIAELPALPQPLGRKRWGMLRVVLTGCLAGLVLAFVAEASRVEFGRNLHTVVTGRVFRCAQLSPESLQETVRAYRIRTVVNLRGCCAPQDWYLDECRATEAVDVAQEDICLSAGRLPSVHEIRRLVEVLDRTEYPILIHCRHGSDRTGLVSAIVQLLDTEIPLEQGRKQLSLRYGHLAVGRPANLDRFFDLYAEWLQEQGHDHSRAVFRRWLEGEYCPGECRARLEVLNAPAWVPLGKPIGLRVRCHNTSVKTWHLHPGSRAGIHALFAICDADCHAEGEGKAGLFEADVPPGQFIDLTLALPPLNKPGKHYVLVDMTDEQHCEFYKTGSEPLTWELEVRDEKPH